KIEHSIFEGMEIHGVPETTICNGKIAWHDNVLIAESGNGKYIDRPAYAPFYEALRKRKELNQPKAVAR
ncbi:MAG: dihydropyrimidinase, partial [Gammaproteobacteria bacterium]|nr:dihydropyrimidinase [Gammaproteobacteria bacterium]MBU2024935.1 dihydropyrimidinase [Gammaproteobacteria bacterium]